MENLGFPSPKVELFLSGNHPRKIFVSEVVATMYECAPGQDSSTVASGVLPYAEHQNRSDSNHKEADHDRTEEANVIQSFGKLGSEKVTRRVGFAPGGAAPKNRTNILE